MGHDPKDDLGHGNYLPRTFLRITPLDEAGRRALWARFEPFLKDGAYECDGTFVELRAGREGDDDRLLLKEGDVLTRETIANLVGILLTTKFAFEQ